MGGSWWLRFWLIVASCLLAVWSLIPTFMGESAIERYAAQAEQFKDDAPSDTEEATPAEDLPWYWGYLPETRIVLGLDLQGGIDITLGVGVEEAVLSTVARDVQPLRDYAEGEGLDLAAVERVRGEPAMEVQLGDGVTLEELTALMRDRFFGYEYGTTRTDEEGVEWHRWELTEEEQAEIGKRAVEQALETLRSRIDETGVKEPSIVRKGEDRINIQLPGVDDLATAKAVIGSQAMLEFFMVDEEFGDSKLAKVVEAAEKKMSAEDFADDGLLTDWLRSTGRIGRNNKVLWEYAPNPDNTKSRRTPYILIDRVELTGDDINDASVSIDQYNEPFVSIEFKPAGGKKFADLTGENVGNRFAIVLDSQVQSAPNIIEKIAGGRARITMGYGDYNQLMQEASVLSLVLRTGALPAPVNFEDVRTVGASLGADSIDAGKRGVLVGGALVTVFMFLVYRNRTNVVGVFASPGVIAIFALGLNVLFIMALLAGFEATLTLPGIAGIALTIGMALDANIIVFERIREELKLGKKARPAVDAGFEHALSAVIDANITTAIAGVVLYSYGTGPIKGFAVTLLIGITTTLYTAIFISRTFMDLLVRKSTTRLVI